MPTMASMDQIMSHFYMKTLLLHQILQAPWRVSIEDLKICEISKSTLRPYLRNFDFAPLQLQIKFSDNWYLSIWWGTIYGQVMKMLHIIITLLQKTISLHPLWLVQLNDRIFCLTNQHLAFIVLILLYVTKLSSYIFSDWLNKW